MRKLGRVAALNAAVLSLPWVAAMLRGGAVAMAEQFRGLRVGRARPHFLSNRSKYTPHQGAQECARRVRQMEATHAGA